MTKPYDNQDCGGNYCNVPVAHDAGIGDDQIVSPVAAGETEDLLVPNTAARLNLLATGTNPATVVIVDGTTAKDGSITVPNGVQVGIDCAGMGGRPVTNDYPNIIRVTAGATSPVSFWFDCTTTDGE